MEDNLKKYKNEYDGTKISKEADKRIKLTLENLPEQKKGKTHNIAIAAIVFLCISALLSTTVFQAEAYSLMKSVFGYFIKDNKLNDNYDKYANTINKTISDNGVKITIDSIVSDSLGVTFGYTINNTNKTIKGAELGIERLLVNGKEVDFQQETSAYKELNDNQYVGYQFLKVKDLTKNYKLEIVITNVEGINGKWDFKLDTSNAKINKNTFTTNESFEKKSENVTLNISKVISTPLKSYIELTYTSKKPLSSEDKVPYSTVFLMDEKSRMVNIEDVKSTIVDEYTYKTEFYIKEYKGQLNKLTIIPYKEPEISKEPRKLEDDNEFYNLKTKVPFSINAGDLGSININSITQAKDKILVNCSTDSVYGDLLINSLGLGYDVKLNAAPGIYNFNPISFNNDTMNRLKTLTNFNNVVLEFDKESTLKDDKYMLVFQKYIKGIKVYPELKITIPID